MHHAVQRLRGSSQGFAKAGELAGCGVAQFQVKVHRVARNAQVFHATRAHKIFAGIRIHHALKRRKDAAFSHCHRHTPRSIAVESSRAGPEAGFCGIEHPRAQRRRPVTGSGQTLKQQRLRPKDERRSWPRFDRDRSRSGVPASHWFEYLPGSSEPAASPGYAPDSQPGHRQAPD